MDKRLIPTNGMVISFEHRVKPLVLEARFRSFLRALGVFTHLVWPLTDELDTDGWQRVAEDDVFVLFVAPG